MRGGRRGGLWSEEEIASSGTGSERAHARNGSERTVTLDANHRGHLLIHLRDAGEECPRPATAIAASSLPRTRETRSNRRAAGSSLPCTLNTSTPAATQGASISSMEWRSRERGIARQTRWHRPDRLAEEGIPVPAICGRSGGGAPSLAYPGSAHFSWRRLFGPQCTQHSTRRPLSSLIAGISAGVSAVGRTTAWAPISRA